MSSSSQVEAVAPRHAVAFPRRVSVELTNHCNQRCPSCPRLGFQRPLGFMQLEVFERVAAECAPRGTRLWLHFLGEPLLHREVVTMIRRAKQLGVVEVGLSTNAVALESHADALLDSGLDRLECSMDADQRDAYATLRGRDHFERVVANVRGFLARKRARRARLPVTSIQYLRTPAVAGDLAAIVDRWRPLLGADDFVMTIEPASFLGAVPSGATPAPESRRPCDWLFESLVVLQDGTVTMCGADWDATAPLGNVATTTLGEIWNGAEMEYRRRAHLERRFAAVSPCATCTDWRLADGSGYRNAMVEIAKDAADENQGNVDRKNGDSQTWISQRS